MREATTQSKVDYFRLTRPLWKNSGSTCPKKRNKSNKRGGRPRVSDRASANAIWYVLCGRDASGRGSPSGVVGGLLQRRSRAFPEVEEDGHLREGDEVDGWVLR